MAVGDRIVDSHKARWVSYIAAMQGMGKRISATADTEVLGMVAAVMFAKAQSPKTSSERGTRLEAGPEALCSKVAAARSMTGVTS
jgi:hypothetical protein